MDQKNLVYGLLAVGTVIAAVVLRRYVIARMPVGRRRKLGELASTLRGPSNSREPVSLKLARVGRRVRAVRRRRIG